MEDQFRKRIHPELLNFYDASSGFDFDHLDTFVPKMNAMELEALREDPAVHTHERLIPGPPSAPAVKVRIYEPAERKDLRPGLLFFHGGGFLFGSVYRQEALCQRYAKHVNCVVVSVEYRLAPHAKAPAPVEDGYAVLCWLYEHGEELGVDKNRLALSGLSAGGTIVAALSMMARDRKGPRPLLQLPLYGEMDAKLQTASVREFTSPKVWSYQNNKTSWELYLDPGKEPHYYDSPALCEDLSDLPPLFSYVGELDPVRDENILFWNRLMQAGIPVECHVFPGAYHCFELGTPEAEYSRLAYELTYAALNRAFYD